MSDVSVESSNNRLRRRIIGVPKRCWCGEYISEKISKSELNPYRRYYRCNFAIATKLRNDNHSFKWVDEALLDEIDVLQAKNALMENDMKMMRSDRIEFEKIMLEKIHMQVHNEISENVEQALAEATCSVRKMMIYVVLGCVTVVGIMKLIG